MSDKKVKCTCGREIATEEESKAAHDAKRCKECYEFEQYFKAIQKKEIK